MALFIKCGSINTKLVVIALAVIPLISCNVAYGWASTEKATSQYILGIPLPQKWLNEHKMILQYAYEKLKNDPAYSPDKFPELTEIERWDWIRFNLKFNFTLRREGPGPDAEGIKYSNHWYNPQTGKGNAPNAAAEHYAALKRYLLITPLIAEKDAAYLAHYVADMSVPYHLTGMPSEDATKIYNDYIALQEICKNNPEDSPEEVKSNFTKAKGYWPEYLDVKREALPSSHYPVIVLKPHIKLNSNIVGPDSNSSATWEEAVLSWKEDNTSDNDWFDPWFYNGVLAGATLSSDHIGWELFTHQKPGNKLTGYASDFDQQYGNGNEANIADFAKKVAEYTHRQNWWAVSTDTADILDQAITNVYTVWRASFSALRPNVTVVTDPKFCSPKIVVKVKNLATSETAKDVKIKMVTALAEFTPISCNTPRSEEDKGYIVGDIQPGAEVTVAWKVKNYDYYNDVWLKIVVTGKFENTPDSGEAVLEEIIPISPKCQDDCPAECQCLLEEEAQERFRKLGTKAVLGSSGADWGTVRTNATLNATYYEKCAEDPCGCDGSRPKYCFKAKEVYADKKLVLRVV